MSNNKKPKSRVYVSISYEARRKLRVLANEQNMTMKGYVNKLIDTKYATYERYYAKLLKDKLSNNN